MSEIVKVLTDIVNNPEGTKVCSYGDNIEFAKLWNDEFDQLWKPDGLPQYKTYVIVWDDIPHREKNYVVATSKYLTPIDWAVAFSLAVHDKAAAEKKEDGKPKSGYPDLRILILDLNSQSVSNADSVRLVNQSKDRSIMSMPWVSLYRPLDAEDFIKDLRNLDAVSSMKDEIEKSDMGIIRNVWAAFLTKPSTPGDHHAIANLVGPLLLMGEEENPDQHTKALRSLMKALGLIPKEAKREAFPWIQWDAQKLEKVLKKDGKLNLILIDDQYHQGWGEVLCKAVGANYERKGPEAKLVPLSSNQGHISVKAATSAEWLINKLRDWKDQRFCFSIDPENADGKASEILFLDLRLFSGKSLDDEIKFFEDLIGIGREILKKEKEGKVLPWPSFDEEKEFKRVEKWFGKDGKKREDDEYIVALTFLPRILALTDLSLPIVIFSSTGRRNIAETLKPYGNIITDFDKPKFTVDMPEDVAEQTKRKFEEAIEKALSILATRNICNKVQTLDEQAKTCPPLIPKSTSIPQFKHIEIYIDEQGEIQDNQFSVGGLIIGYPDYSKVLELSDELKKQCIYWYSPDPTDNKHLSKRPNKQNEGYQGKCADTNWNYTDTTRRCIEICMNKNIFASAACVNDIASGGNGNSGERHFPLKDTQSDSRYERVVKTLLELILFELIPEYVTKNISGITVSVFAGTRTPRINMSNQFSNENPTDYFGYGVAPKKDTFYTIAEGSLVVMLANLLKMRNKIPKWMTIHHSRGVTLTYGIPTTNKWGKATNKQPWAGIRVQHYFADIMLSDKTNFCDQFNNGFDISGDNSLYNLLDAYREMLNNDNLAKAILYASANNNISDKVRAHIVEKIADRLNTAKGSFFF